MPPFASTTPRLAGSGFFVRELCAIGFAESMAQGFSGAASTQKRRQRIADLRFGQRHPGFVGRQTFADIRDGKQLPTHGFDERHPATNLLSAMHKRSIHAASALFLFITLAFALAHAEEPDRLGDRFALLEIAVEGNTALPVQRIEEAVYAFLGEAKTIQDVEAARAALENAYHDGGYQTVFVDIPEQEVNRGTVRLRVTEGAVERLRVSGSRYYSLGRIKAVAPELAEGKVPYFPAVQKQLAALNQAGDRRVTPLLRPGRTPGKVEVELKVADKPPLHGSVELNDRYSANTTKTRLSASLRYDNLFQHEQSLSLSAQTAPENTDESKVLSATYVWPLAGGNYLAAYGVISESDVAAVGDINVVGNGKIAGLRYIVPLRARPAYSHSLTLGVDYKDFDETVLLQGADSANTPISYLPFSLGYEGTQQGQSSQTKYGATLNFSLRGLADEQVECLPGVFLDEFACKRSGGKANYAYLRLDLKHTRQFAAGWSASGRLSAQVANGPLISNEQFAAGGADSVRGYTESNAAGDDGMIAGLELRAPSLTVGRQSLLDAGVTELSPYLFAEGASLQVQSALSGQTDRFDLLSAGVGLRFRGWGGVNGALDLAYPFEDAGQVQAGDGRVHFRLGYEW
jgi:hemolysin activation/secretion protein